MTTTGGHTEVHEAIARCYRRDGTDHALRRRPAMRSFALSSALAAALSFDATLVAGQDFPNRPIRMVTGGTGSLSDVMLRLITPSLGSSLGRPVIVENYASVVTSAELVAKAPPDGNT